MLNVGMTELLVFGIIALLVLGPEKLPEAARFAGKWYAKIKRMISSVQTDIDRELRMSELREQMQQEMQRIQELENKMQLQMQALQQQKLETEAMQKPAITLEKPTVPMRYYTPIQAHKHSTLLSRFNKTIPPIASVTTPVLTTAPDLPELKVAV